MRKISQEELNKILKEHELWLKGEGRKCADLSNANLRGINLSNVDLTGANLNNADLNNADLSNTDFSNVNLRCANLEDANLRGATLVHTDLKCNTLIRADLTSANLSNANLSSANLSNADLKDIKTNIHTIGYNLACPEKGSFIGYKKAGGCIVKLLILEDSKRSSATTIKCRCDKAKVLDIENIETEEKITKINSNHDSNFIYRVGEIVHVDNFDNNRWNECSTGIHFFINKENAINY